MEVRIQRSDELTHWGIKGQKWGVRRYQNEDGTLTAAGKKRYYYQNPDGSLTEEGKKHYMEAARKGKLNPKKLSDDDLNMINQRFAREKTYAQNVAEYEKSKFSYKLKEAVITRVKGKGGGGGKKGGGGKGIASLLAMPIKKAFEDALKFDPNKGGGNSGGGKDDYERDTSKKDYERYQKNGHRFVEKYKPEKLSKKEREANRRRGERFVQEGRTAEDVLRGRSHGSSGRTYATENRSSRSVRGLPSGGIYMDSSDYSIHSGITHYKVTRKPQSDELMHFGIKGQKWGVRRFENADGTLTEEGKKRYSSSEIGKSESASTERHPDFDYRTGDGIGDYVYNKIHRPFIDAANSDVVWRKYKLGQDTVNEFVEQKKFSDMVNHISESTKEARDIAVKAANTAVESKESMRKPGPLWEKMNRKSVEYWDKFSDVATEYIDKNFSGDDKEVAKGIVYWWFIDW